MKERSEVGIDPQSLTCGFLNKLWTLHVEMGVLESIGSDVPNLMKDVPNFVNDVPRVQKSVMKWRSAPNHFLMGF